MIRVGFHKTILELEIFGHRQVLVRETAFTSLSDFGVLFRWLGVTLVVLFLLQLGALVVAVEIRDQSYQLIVVEKFVHGAPMAFVGLFLMLIGSKIAALGAQQSFINRNLVFGLTSLFIVLTIFIFGLLFTANQTVIKQTDQFIAQRRNQVKLLRDYSRDSKSLKDLGNQLVLSGQLSADSSMADQHLAARKFVKNQLKGISVQLEEAEQQRNIELNQRLLSGFLTLVVLLVAFALISLTSLTMKF